ncbi:MAG: hypothetical protein ACREDG_06505 [Methylocella sp.]
MDKTCVSMGAQAVVAKFLATFKEYPPRQRAASFSVDQIIEKMQRSLSTPTSD